MYGALLVEFKKFEAHVLFIESNEANMILFSCWKMSEKNEEKAFYLKSLYDQKGTK